MEKQLNIGVVGLGTVGSEVVTLIQQNSDYYAQKLGKALQIKGVYTRSPQGEKSREVYQRNPEIFKSSMEEIVNDPEVDIVVETMGGIGGAKVLISKAIETGKSVVTANKDLISTHGEELRTLANIKGVGLGFEAAVAGGIPIINTLTNGLGGDNLLGLRGIINGTCNYILTKLRENPNLSYIEVLQEAQRLGYAESDPSNDVEGIDSFYKLSILGEVGFGKKLPKETTDIKGISSISGIDFFYAGQLRKSIKLLGVIQRAQDNIMTAFVGPVLLDNNHPMANINGVTNAIEVIGQNATTTYVGPGAGGKATATAVISDLINIGRNIESKKFRGESRNISTTNLEIGSIEKQRSSYYCRFTIQDQLGIIYETSKILGRYGISINQVLQHIHREDEKASLPYVMTLESTSEGDVRKAIAEIDKLPFIKSPTFVMRILD